jgi:hypothetical protein
MITNTPGAFRQNENVYFNLLVPLKRENENRTDIHPNILVLNDGRLEPDAYLEVPKHPTKFLKSRSSVITKQTFAEESVVNSSVLQ